MSGIFFDGLELPHADINLGVGSGSHAAQTGAMLKGIEDVLIAERPDWLLIYGDTNSTLAGALAASKLHVPVAHVEAGLRSFNRQMPEEINRVVADHLSDLCCARATPRWRISRLRASQRHVHLVGDVMLDVLNWAKQRTARTPTGDSATDRPAAKAYLLATVHRSENTDDPARLSSIVSGVQCARRTDRVPGSSSHPQGDRRHGLSAARSRPPNRSLGYLDMVDVDSAPRGWC